MPVQAVPNEFLDEFPDLAGLATGDKAISPSLLSALFNAVPRDHQSSWRNENMVSAAG